MPLIRNAREVLGSLSSRRREVGLLMRMYEAAVEAVMPERVMRRRVRRRGRVLIIDGLRLDLDRFRSVVLIAAGKAAPGMASYTARLLGERLGRGVVVMPRGSEAPSLPECISVREAGHPVPDADGLAASREVLEICGEAGRGDLLIVLISGGASALLPAPAEPLSLEDKISLTRSLLSSGAGISELNAVRKHLSMLKGGLLAKHAQGARIISLIISDVVGDRLDVIASGPTAPDPTTYRDAYRVLARYGLWEDAPAPVRRRIELGMAGALPETPKPGSETFRRVSNIILAGVSTACGAAARLSRREGVRSLILTTELEGEARTAGYILSSAPRTIGSGSSFLVIAGGETTVNVVGRGTGGRSQELALAAAIKMRGRRRSALLAAGTDGVDGPTDAAGAIATDETYDAAVDSGLDPEVYLSENDSYSFFKRVGGLLLTGPTGTNVGDIVLSLYSKS